MSANLDTTMSAAMARAGISVNSSRLRIAADDAMAKHHSNVERAARTLAKEAKAADLIEELALYFLRHYRLPDSDHSFRDNHLSDVRDRQIQNGGPLGSANREFAAASNGSGLSSSEAHSPNAAPVREPSASQVATEIAVKTRSAINAFDRELTRTGQRWGNVCYSELANMTEDGEIAYAVRMHIGSLRGEKALKPIRDLMTPREFAILINKIRKEIA